ncbi:sensor histidine kinase [Luteibaculum oceani]|uniref:histidine kinase n=1 Tax=Luteibaculum oceani TaxID=1294296 RepID=A0A5C6VJJ6_9FLAO|nr:HAMP domain-containing sensor histidine kinase [Luteibaculum oceani]TXC85090.1 HAMP domain-containing histidine kinase [Luteibaculum oceani]
MNLYSRKQGTKIVLFILASLIIGVSLFYSNRIVNKIRNEERQKVRLWSNAIQNKADLVAYTQKLFETLRSEERKKVKHWFMAISILTSNETNDLDQKTFKLLTDIISDNTTIPIIVVDDKGEVVIEKNILENSAPTDSILSAELEKMKKAFPPLEIEYTKNKRQYLYYRESHIFRELQQVMDNLINNFISETVINSASVPVIFTDGSHEKVIASGNIDSIVINTPELLAAMIEEMSEQNAPIKVALEQEDHYIFYKDSFILTQLRYYPYIQLVAIAVFLLISYLLFSTFRNAEQNQVWVGMAKETAHQLGTPLSSLLAWKDVLESQGVDKSTLKEMGNDIKRLEVITARFSKIGAAPELSPRKMLPIINAGVDYLKPRIPRTVEINISAEDANTAAKINIQLFEWVLENLIKNAVDAMQGSGKIDINLQSKGAEVIIDITDTGKGIPANKQKTVFEPGYTTRKRGWGLGLTLVKRIIEDYHKGKIFVKHSEPGVGTTFRILLRA